MPNLSVIDTHVHLTNLERISYPWVKAAPKLARSHGLDNYREATGPVEVGSFVFIEVGCAADQAIDEVAWVSEIAEQDSRLKGIVAQASLERGDAVEATLELLAQRPLVRGIRRLLESEDVEFCLQANFICGLKLLPKYNFCFDICINHRHLANVLKMVEQCPGVSFILDHIAKPDIKNQLFEPWKTEIRLLAEFPNVVCKISGMVTEADHEKWKREELKPYIDHVIECFSFERVIFGGDWFVSTLATSYPEWVAALDWAVEGSSEAELQKLYSDNAKAVYRLMS